MEGPASNRRRGTRQERMGCIMATFTIFTARTIQQTKPPPTPSCLKNYNRACFLRLPSQTLHTSYVLRPRTIIVEEKSIDAMVASSRKRPAGEPGISLVDAMARVPLMSVDSSSYESRSAARNDGVYVARNRIERKLPDDHSIETAASSDSKTCTVSSQSRELCSCQSISSATNAGRLHKERRRLAQNRIEQKRPGDHGIAIVS